jgi:hypothetical protein
MFRYALLVAGLLSPMTLHAQSFPESFHVTAVRIGDVHSLGSCSDCAKTPYTIEGYMKDGGYTIEYVLTCEDLFGAGRFATACPSVHAGHDYPVKREEGSMAFSPNTYYANDNAKRLSPTITSEREVPKSKP